MVGIVFIFSLLVACRIPFHVIDISTWGWRFYVGTSSASPCSLSGNTHFKPCVLFIICSEVTLTFYLNMRYSLWVHILKNWLLDCSIFFWEVLETKVVASISLETSLGSVSCPILFPVALAASCLPISEQPLSSFFMPKYQSQSTGEWSLWSDELNKSLLPSFFNVFVTVMKPNNLIRNDSFDICIHVCVFIKREFLHRIFKDILFPH